MDIIKEDRNDRSGRLQADRFVELDDDDDGNELQDHSSDLKELVSLLHDRKKMRLVPCLRSIISFKNCQMFLFVVVSAMAAVAFTLVDEHHSEVKSLAALSVDHPKYYDIKPEISDLIKLSISVQANASLLVQLQGQMQSSSSWEPFKNYSFYRHDESRTESLRIDLKEVLFTNFERLRLALESDSISPIGVTFDMAYLTMLARYEVYFAAAILIGLYILIIFDLMHRTVAAMIAAFIALGTLSQLHERPTFETVVSWIDIETVGLLFGMMVMVGIFSTTGFFEWAAVRAYKLSKGNLWYLTLLLCSFTGIVSAFLDNVTTILLVAPVSIKLCKVLDVDPKTMVLAEVIFSNVGGTATVIGDPPNIILANHPDIKPHVDFLTFSLHIFPAIFFSSIALVLYIWKVYATSFHRDPTLHLKNEVAIWKRTLDKFKNNDPENPEEAQVFMYLETFIASLEQQIKKQKEHVLSIDELEERYHIKNWPLFIKSCVVLFLVIIMFFLHSVVGLKLSLAWIAVIGAMVHIILSGITKIEEILEKVEFGTLMFFAALFILMRSLEDLGLINFIGDQLIQVIKAVPEGKTRLLVAVLVLMWVSAFASAFIDNIPYTATLAPVVVQLAHPSTNLGLPLTPLIWALSLGTCLGGNGTLIGASANVVAVGLCEQQGYEVKFMDFFKMGMPVMIITVFVSCIYMCIFHVLIEWY